MFELHRFPLPPTANRIVMPIRGRLIKTQEYRIYEKKIEIYKLRNFKICEQINRELKDGLIFIHRIFVFHIKRVFSKKNEFKSLDTTNRIKIADDMLSKCIGIDDKYFKCGSYEMAFCDSESDEQVIFVIKKGLPLRGFKDIK